MILLVWLVTFLVTAVVGLNVVAYRDKRGEYKVSNSREDWNREAAEDAYMQAFMLALMWPIVLVIATLFFVFSVLTAPGRYLGRRR